MKFTYFLFIFLLIAVAISAEDSQDAEEVAEEKEGKKSKSSSKSNSSGKTKEGTQIQKPDFLVTPDENLVPNEKNPNNFYANENHIPFLGFPDPRAGNPEQNFFLSDGTGRYNVQLQNFQQPALQHFNTALGAISSHIINSQRPNQDYVPYPPNGNPYNYPAYRGFPHATEPPAVRAYETANNLNYNRQTIDNFHNYNPKRLFSNNPYQTLGNQFDNFGIGFYNNPYLFNGPGFYPGLRRNDDSYYDIRFRQQARAFGKPIK